jgi:hypothetical protein
MVNPYMYTIAMYVPAYVCVISVTYMQIMYHDDIVTLHQPNTLGVVYVLNLVKN